MFLLEFVFYATPGSVVMYVIYRKVKAEYQVSVSQLRMRAAQGEARLEAADRAVAVAEGTAREALASTRQALETTRVIELVDERVQNLTEYLVNRIDGEQPQRAAGRHALPGEDLPSITAGGADEGFLS